MDPLDFELDVLYKWYFGDSFGKEKNYEVFYTWVLRCFGMMVSLERHFRRRGSTHETDIARIELSQIV